MLLSGEPSMYGRELAGSRATIATHQPPATTIVANPASRPPIRRRRVVGAASR